MTVVVIVVVVVAAAAAVSAAVAAAAAAVAVAVATAVAVAAAAAAAVTRWLKPVTKLSNQQNWRICSLSYDAQNRQHLFRVFTGHLVFHRWS